MKAKVISLGLILGLVAFPSQQEVKEGKEVKEPKIVLENPSASFCYENQREITKLYAEDSKEAEKLRNEIEALVFKKLKVKSKKEISSKNLWVRYCEEIEKLIKQKKLDQPKPKLKFIDEKGKVVKEILLGLEISKIKKKHPRLNKEHLVMETLRKSAEVSKNNRFVAIIEELSEHIVPETESEEKALDGADADFLSSKGKITYMNERGNILWEKQTPKNMVISDVRISDNGEIITYIQIYQMGGLDENEPYEKFFAYDKKGQELFILPEKRDDKYHGLVLGSLSPKGRFVSIGGFIEYGKESRSFILFIDLQNKTTWETSSKYSPDKIEDNGIAYTSFYDENEKKIKNEVIDLKKYLGK